MIPRSFKLLASEYKVDVIAESSWEHSDCVAYFDPQNNQICILKKNEDLMFHTFWHEATHAIFHAVGRDDLYCDEKLVDLVGGLIAQIINTQSSRPRKRRAKSQ